MHASIRKKNAYSYFVILRYVEMSMHVLQEFEGVTKKYLLSTCHNIFCELLSDCSTYSLFKCSTYSGVNIIRNFFNRFSDSLHKKYSYFKPYGIQRKATLYYKLPKENQNNNFLLLVAFGFCFAPIFHDKEKKEFK